MAAVDVDVDAEEVCQLASEPGEVEERGVSWDIYKEVDIRAQLNASPGDRPNDPHVRDPLPIGQRPDVVPPWRDHVTESRTLDGSTSRRPLHVAQDTFRLARRFLNVGSLPLLPEASCHRIDLPRDESCGLCQWCSRPTSSAHHQSRRQSDRGGQEHIRSCGEGQVLASLYPSLNVGSFGWTLNGTPPKLTQTRRSTASLSRRRPPRSVIPSH